MKSIDVIVILLVCLIVFIAIYLLAPPTAERENLKEQLRQTQEQVDVLNSELREVQLQLTKLKERDPLTIEGIARDKFGLAREGEVIYQFPQDESRREK